MSPDHVRIRYRRPPDREDVFVQRLVHEGAGVLVTLLEYASLDGPMRVDGAVVLEQDSPIVWFTFPGRWHDIGRFHRIDGTFTGLYANILTPVRFLDARTWQTTDLFLDVWQGVDGGTAVLDRDELDDALARGWLDAETADTACAEADRILDLARRGEWPPSAVEDWTIERVRRRLRHG